jgi:hypothetical protein
VKPGASQFAQVLPLGRLVIPQHTNKKSGTVSRPDTIHDFQFPE